MAILTFTTKRRYTCVVVYVIFTNLHWHRNKNERLIENTNCGYKIKSKKRKERGRGKIAACSRFLFSWKISHTLANLAARISTFGILLNPHSFPRKILRRWWTSFLLSTLFSFPIPRLVSPFLIFHFLFSTTLYIRSCITSCIYFSLEFQFAWTNGIVC